MKLRAFAAAVAISALVAAGPGAGVLLAASDDAAGPSGEVEFWAWSTNVEDMVALF